MAGEVHPADVTTEPHQSESTQKMEDSFVCDERRKMGLAGITITGGLTEPPFSLLSPLCSKQRISLQTDLTSNCLNVYACIPN